MKKKTVVLLVIIGCVIAFVFWATADFRQFAGSYQSVDGDSAYEMTLSATGKLHIVDIGAGNPALDGILIRVPFQESEHILITWGETDYNFLNTGKSLKTIDVWYSVIGHLNEDDSELTSFKVVSFEGPGNSHIQFNESAYFYAVDEQPE